MIFTLQKVFQQNLKSTETLLDAMSCWFWNYKQEAK